MARLVRHPGQQTSSQGISASMAALMLGDHIPLPRRERGIPFRDDMHRFVGGSLLGRSFLHVHARPAYREVKLIKETAAAAKQDRAMQWRSSPMTRSPVSMRSPTRPRTCRPNLAGLQPSGAIMHTSTTARSVCWAESICYRPSSRPRQGPPSQPRIHRISPAPRRCLSDPYGDQADPRQSLRTDFRGDQGLTGRSARGRFEFAFTPKHGSWLNLIEGCFSKLARSVLRHIRVASKQELKDRIMAAHG